MHAGKIKNIKLLTLREKKTNFLVIILIMFSNLWQFFLFKNIPVRLLSEVHVNSHPRSPIGSVVKMIMQNTFFCHKLKFTNPISLRPDGDISDFEYLI